MRGIIHIGIRIVEVSIVIHNPLLRSKCTANCEQPNTRHAEYHAVLFTAHIGSAPLPAFSSVSLDIITTSISEIFVSRVNGFRNRGKLVS